MTLGHRFESEGGGAVILLLNGGMMTYTSWEPVAVALRPKCRLLLCDLRGQLLSPGPSHRDLAGHVGDLEALLDYLDLDSVHVLATSFGAAVGVLLAAFLPERVRSLAAVTATDRVTPSIVEGIEDLRRLVADAEAGGDRGRFHDRLAEEVYSEAYRRAHREELAERRRQVGALPDLWFVGLEGILASMERLDLTPHLPAVRCPVLVAIAAGDRTIPPERSRALAAAIPGAEVVEHPTSGHALVAEDPAWLAERYLTFLGRIAS